MNRAHDFIRAAGRVLAAASLMLFALCCSRVDAKDWLAEFRTPPESARPWVYWYFMDGNLTREGMTADLEAMKRAGIGGAIFLEVDIGVPRGPVKFMSEPWQELVRHAVAEANRLGIEIALGAGPGWCGTGGPWVKPEQSMQHLVASETSVKGPRRFDAELPRPKPRTPFFGEGTLTPELARQWKEFYAEVAVLAFPTPSGKLRLADIDEKALYHRAPFSSQPGVKPFLPAPARHPESPVEQCVVSGQIVDLTGRLTPEGRLNWQVPPGDWTILRFCRTATGQTTRPAPAPGLGFESDKFDKRALDSHFDAFTGKLIKLIGPQPSSGRGLTTMHFDSWEMSSQNWSEKFRGEFRTRRGYDPLRYLPAMTGRVVDSVELSERFLWDLRQTAQELVVENHAMHLKMLSHRNGLQLSLEPYDLNPTSDLTLGSVADVPMCEFWYKGFDTAYSVFEAASVGHTGGRPIVAAESFTSEPGEDWRGYPGAMKNLGDWAFAAGVNRIAFHRYQHQPWLDRRPGMRMGSYGVHWERTQTWWDLVPAYHTYLARCQQMLRQGLPVADILYLAPEGAPHVFRPPASALRDSPPDRPGHNFDGCSPEVLRSRASVKNDRIVFPDGMSYRLLVLPQFDTMTPGLLKKIKELAEQGATVLGAPPSASPSLVDYPGCDTEVRRLAKEIWGDPSDRSPAPFRKLGKGRVFLDRNPLPDMLDNNPIAEARWIWHAEAGPALEAPVATRHFQTRFTVPSGKPVVSARLYATADNSFEAFINGSRIGGGDNFHRVQQLNALAFVKPGENTILISASNTGDKPNPAGLLAALSLKFADGSAATVSTDGSWTSGLTPDQANAKVRELGPVGAAPWHLNPSLNEPRDIYPAYDSVASIFQADRVPPDFACPGPIRYTHRQQGGDHLYFVANTTPQLVRTAARFRVTGLQPELWDAVTGKNRKLPSFAQGDGVTTVPLDFESHQSYFIVFRQRAGHSRTDRSNFGGTREAGTVAGPWEVQFDPAWGAPAQVTFPELTDWTNRAETGIRHYSGKATYRAAFEVERSLIKGATYLDLGKVNVMASVKINDRDCGTVWCAPWRVEVPPGTLRPGSNTLEITVANLWVNRLIGDAALPPGQRLTWTTSNPYKPDSPLLSSGLIGPVTLKLPTGD